MQKYRAISKVSKGGAKEWYVQERVLLFWRDVRSTYGSKEPVKFRTKDLATRFIIELENI